MINVHVVIQAAQFAQAEIVQQFPKQLQIPIIAQVLQRDFQRLRSLVRRAVSSLQYG